MSRPSDLKSGENKVFERTHGQIHSAFSYIGDFQRRMFPGDACSSLIVLHRRGHLRNDLSKFYHQAGIWREIAVEVQQSMEPPGTFLNKDGGGTSTGGGLTSEWWKTKIRYFRFGVYAIILERLSFRKPRCSQFTYSVELQWRVFLLTALQRRHPLRRPRELLRSNNRR